MWRNNKEGLAYIQLRDYGHQVLASRKERRKFSLLGLRRFMGDYLDVGGSHGEGSWSAEGQLLREASGMGPSEEVAFSSRIQLLVSRLGRSSVRSPRFFIMTDTAVYIVITQVVNKQVQTTCERKITLGAISAVGLSNLRDDWVVLNVNNAEEPDPVFHCYFKTELVTHLLQRTNGGVHVNVSSSLEYSKKKDKKSHITFKKDETVKKDDVYKSSTVSVCSGEPASSVSKPAPKKKPGMVRPITQGKLLRAGGPSNTKNKPKPRMVPQSNSVAVPANLSSSGNGKHVGGATSAVGVGASAASKRASGAPPPLPPLPPAASPAESQIPTYKALYAFATEQSGEMPLEKDDVVEVTQKDESGSGWWLVKKNGAEGWAPSNYLELIPKAPPKPKVAPPPPVKRPPSGAPSSQDTGPSTLVSKPSIAPKPLMGGALALQPKPAARATQNGAKPHERAHAVQADANAAPIAVMPGLGAPGGFAAVLAKKKAENAAAANGSGSGEQSMAAFPARPPVTPKVGTSGRMPPPPPRR
jgi:myosin-1